MGLRGGVGVDRGHVMSLLTQRRRLILPCVCLCVCWVDGGQTDGDRLNSLSL